MTHQTYSQLIAIKQWADRGLCDVAGCNLDRLSNEDNFLMLRVLDHIHTVDQIFRHHLQELPHSFTAPRSDVMPPFKALAEGIRETDAWYTAYVGGLAARDIDQPIDFVFTSGKPARMTRGEMLLHVCLHGTYHRGNAGALLQLRGIVPSPDAITDYLEDAA
jgi:uncharacterized damage-inducible protein DinB